MAFVDYKSDKAECPRIFEKLTDLHLKGNKYRGDSVLSSLLADSPNLVKLSVQVKALTGNTGRRVLSDEVVAELLGRRKALLGLEEISLGLVESHHGGPQARLGLTSLTLTSLLSHCPRLEVIGDLASWDLEDMEETLEMLSTHWAWTRST